jgi:two-component system OmpR family response regulator
MNDPLSDGIENTIDIFLLSQSESSAPLVTEHLEQKGYRVTPFSDVNYLFETLRFGKPNLLICDSLSLGDEAFGICRQIKADGDLWMVPVLIMTRASSLSDLLFVLDSNADNFIAYPYDPPYLQSLVEGMLVTPVER